MNNDGMKEVIQQQGILLSSVVILLFKIVYNVDGVNFSQSVNSDLMTDILKESIILTQKTRSGPSVISDFSGGAWYD